MNSASVQHWLMLGMSPLWQKANRRLLERGEREFKLWLQETAEKAAPEDDQELWLMRRLLEFLSLTINRQHDSIKVLRNQFVDFKKYHSHAATEAERQHHILEFCRQLGASEKQLKGDKQAFSRWFGQDAVLDRYQRRHSELEFYLSFTLERLSVIAAHYLGQSRDRAELLLQWEGLAIESLARPLLVYEGDSRVKVAAFQAIVTSLQALPAEVMGHLISDATIQFAYRSAIDRRQNHWIQCQALALIDLLSPESLHKALFKRLRQPHQGDDLFVRHRAVQLLGRRLTELPGLAELLPVLCDDPSPLVRQALAGILSSVPMLHLDLLLSRLASDKESAVRAALLLSLLELLEEKQYYRHVAAVISRLLAHEQDSFVLRVAIRVLQQGFTLLQQAEWHDLSEHWLKLSNKLLADLHQSKQETSVRRWAAQARETIWSESSPTLRQQKQLLQQQLATLGSGKSKSIDKALLGDIDEETICRLLSVLVQDDFGVTLAFEKHRIIMSRGDVQTTRAWRVLHELRRPSTEKRQGFRHTIGRLFQGEQHIPSGILAEMAQTKVPGEPLYMEEEGGWRGYLPLVDQVISLLDTARPEQVGQIFSSEGVTQVIVPRSLGKRIKAKYVLSSRFEYYATLRNWREQDGHSADAYVHALAEIGIELRFNAHVDEEVPAWQTDSQVQRFFPALVPFSEMDLPGQMRDYFFSVYENSLQELALFLTAATGLFVGRHVYQTRKLRQARQSLPLVIGGWGTRGKSGVERLKAALFNALGYNVMSKTTGCEAMFLHAPAYGQLRELFLFRPYEKASIWEQAGLTRLAEQLNTDVFLWECMGLNPDFITILQRQWMQDDVSTITNTYPDHEDLQGPAGADIPKVMTRFIPDNAKLLSSEEQMLPILREAADERGTSTHAVGWLEAGLLTSDVLDRFPYDEHPHNIALVLALCDELGIAHDFALKEMADRVVPDLGVLKSYPVAQLKGRRLEFVNGMSANERFACLQNWQRMGFAHQVESADMSVWLSAVVNNRADRVARSRVFAEVLVEDLGADQYILIGTNLEGLTGDIGKAWQSYAKGLSLWSTPHRTPHQLMHRIARHLRLPLTTEQIKNRLRAMLDGVPAPLVDEILAVWQLPEKVAELMRQSDLADYADDVHKRLGADLAISKNMIELLKQTQSASKKQRDVIDKTMRMHLWQWFESKLIIIKDAHATGDEIIEQLCQSAPPGMLNRIMGIQNIKGTGLDFIYRWQAWERCYQACIKLDTEEPEQAHVGLNELLALHDIGLLGSEYVQQVIEGVRHQSFAQREVFQAELEMIESRIKQQLDSVAKYKNSKPASGVLANFIEAIEAFLDSGDAVRRRKIADLIYKDLAAERISYDQAAIELKALNQRQKGGWLQRRLNVMFSRD